jgi:hypothetical protein
VAAASDGHFEAQLARDVDGVDDVGHATASGDQCGAFVNQSVVDLPCLLVTRVDGLEELAREPAGKFADGVGKR